MYRIIYINCTFSYITKGSDNIIDYTPYRDLLKNKGIKQQELINAGVINTRVANQLKHNRSVTLETLDKICNKLHCDFSDLVRHIEDNEEDKEI